MHGGSGTAKLNWDVAACDVQAFGEKVSYIGIAQAD
jgi:hypothetical protein